MAWDWFWTASLPSKADIKAKAQEARQEASQAAQTPFEGAPPPFLKAERAARKGHGSNDLAPTASAAKGSLG
jgi:hypothetical protein